MKIRSLIISLSVITCIVGWGPFLRATSSEAPGTATWVNQTVHDINYQASNLNPNVLKLALTAYSKARHEGYDNKQLLTIIDYSKPSTEKRLWVIDLKKDKVLFNTWVAHGKNSGQLNATSFSNASGSLKSSLGVFVTEETYMGGEGYSLRLNGLEKGINNNAYNRSVVIHGAWYVAPDVIHRYGQAGRSWGCPAVDAHIVKPLINTIKDKTVVFAYYPDRKWLNHSSYLS